MDPSYPQSKPISETSPRSRSVDRGIRRGDSSHRNHSRVRYTGNAGGTDTDLCAERCRTGSSPENSARRIASCEVVGSKSLARLTAFTHFGSSRQDLAPATLGYSASELGEANSDFGIRHSGDDVNGWRNDSGQSTIEVLAALPLCAAAATTMVFCGSAVRQQMLLERAATQGALASLHGDSPDAAVRKFVRTSGVRGVLVTSSASTVVVSKQVHGIELRATASVGERGES